MALSNLQQRVLTGIIGGSAVVFCLVFNQWSYFVFILALGIAGQWEFYQLIKNDGEDPLIKWGMLNGVLLSLISFFVLRGDLSTKFYLILFLLLGIIFISELYRKSSNPFENIAFTIIGIFYVAVPMCLLHFSAFSQGKFSTQIVSGIFFILWASDSGAYFAGKAFGKHKLFERISPKKTWEGFFGGLALASILAYILGIYYTDLPTWKWISLACIITTIGTYGDLVESMLKRSLQIKDSGNIIPGHGGILDRFDGLLLASPFIAFFLEFS
ncbi:MAG: phosphatidate cytidylyltransferase [Bacteroidetes bacterium]|nr:MAG: phosphatidate cytidylyltransferase [Bacteroidota bacterium]